MSEQFEAIAAAQSYGSVPAQDMQYLYESTERLGFDTPIAYVVDGDRTATYSA